MLNVVPVETERENFVINFPETWFHAQAASINLLRKSGPLGHFWKRILLENTVSLPKKN
jgi:hypothetical protein